MSAFIVLGAQWGDEGKGKLTDYLAEEANDVVRKACFEYLGLTKDSTDKQIKRALSSDRANQFFEVIEEIIDVQIAHGLSENEFFNQYVETKNMADGDRNEFWVDDEVLLTVGKTSGDHHDLSLQRLGAGQSYHVDTDVYGIKVGGDIRLFLTGRKDWGTLVDAVVDAYMRKVQTMISSAINAITNGNEVLVLFHLVQKQLLMQLLRKLVLLMSVL